MRALFVIALAWSLAGCKAIYRATHANAGKVCAASVSGGSPDGGFVATEEHIRFAASRVGVPCEELREVHFVATTVNSIPTKADGGEQWGVYRRSPPSITWLWGSPTALCHEMLHRSDDLHGRLQAGMDPHAGWDGGDYHARQINCSGAYAD